MKHRITLSTEELSALETRLVPLKVVDFDQKTYALLRGIYGKVISAQLREPRTKILDE